MILPSACSLDAAPKLALRLLAAPRRVLLTGAGGRAGVTGFVLRLMTQAALGGRAVRFICGDNRFDPYFISALTRQAGGDVRLVLERIFIARAFTAYQLYELVARLSSLVGDELVIIANPCATFFDEDVPRVDAARYFYRLLWQMVRLTETGLPLLLTQPNLQSAQRGYFATDLARLANIVLRVDGAAASVQLEQHRRPNLPQLAGAPREF